MNFLDEQLESLPPRVLFDRIRQRASERMKPLGEVEGTGLYGYRNISVRVLVQVAPSWVILDYYGAWDQRESALETGREWCAAIRAIDDSGWPESPIRPVYVARLNAEGAVEVVSLEWGDRFKHLALPEDLPPWWDFKPRPWS